MPPASLCIRDLTRPTWQACCLALVCCAGWTHAAPAPRTRPASTRPAYEPTADYVRREAAGWTVLIHKRLLAEEGNLAKESLEQIELALRQVRGRLPKTALAKLRGIRFWLAWRNDAFPGATYHPSATWLREHGHNPDKARGIEIGRPDRFARTAVLHPSWLIAILADAYWDVALGSGDARVEAAWRRAKASGLYDRVARAGGGHSRHPGLANPRKFFTAISECYLHAAGRWPYVWGELAAHDPQTFELMGELWGVLGQYEKRRIDGWTVYVSRDLLAREPKTATAAVKQLTAQLYNVTRAVPPEALARLRRVGIWLEREGTVPCACYHTGPGLSPDGSFNPHQIRCVELANAGTFVRWTVGQPWMVLHELAHAYHDRVLGWDHAGVKAAYDQAMKAGVYKSVLHVNGRTQPAYAARNEREYFSELSEAYFGTNDFFPFVRVELKHHDPAGYAMMEKLWTHPPHKAHPTSGPAGK